MRFALSANLASILLLNGLASSVVSALEVPARPLVAALGPKDHPPQAQLWAKYKVIKKRADPDSGTGTGAGSGTPTEQQNSGYSPLPVINGGTITKSVQTQLKVYASSIQGP